MAFPSPITLLASCLLLLFPRTRHAPRLPTPTLRAPSHQCNPTWRRYSGLCTNNLFTLWGSAGRPHLSLAPLHSSAVPAGADLPSARLISNALCRQTKDIYNRRRLNEMTVFFGQFLDHTIVSTPTAAAQMPIPIPPDDPIFANFSSGHLHFARSRRAPVPLSDMFSAPLFPRPLRILRHIQRPLNALTAALDLASVYAVDRRRGHALRTFVNGTLRMGDGAMLPRNAPRFPNAPFPGPAFFLAGDHRANENPALLALHVLFVREHNHICRELRTVFPRWGDQRLFHTARRINEAQFQYVVFEQYYPAMTGRRLPPYKGYSPMTNLGILDVFSTAAFRVGHTMVGRWVNLYAQGNRKVAQVPLQRMFFRKASEYTEGIDVFLRGVMHTTAQEIDLQVHDALRNFLFTGIPVEGVAFDLVALNLQRSRDHAIPTYNQVRSLLGLKCVKSFAGISDDMNVRSRLQAVYGTVDRVEAWVGMMAERNERGSSMGKMLNRIWEMQFRALRDGDRFYYNNGDFVRTLAAKVPRLQKVLNGGNVFRDILVRNTDIALEEVPNKVFFVT